MTLSSKVLIIEEDQIGIVDDALSDSKACNLNMPGNFTDQN